MTIAPEPEAATEDVVVTETPASERQALEPPQPSSPVAAPTATDAATDQTAERLRAEYAEIAAIAAQGARLGVVIDAADAMAKGIAPHALRSAILDRLAARAEASTVVAVAPPPAGSAHPSGGESPIVRRARERASATRS